MNFSVHYDSLRTVTARPGLLMWTTDFGSEHLSLRRLYIFWSLLVPVSSIS
jgi:hypothetical protein